MGTEVNDVKDTSKPQEEKITNLFEDMNYHEHDEKSYEKMIQEQKVNNSEQPQ